MQQLTVDVDNHQLFPVFHLGKRGGPDQHSTYQEKFAFLAQSKIYVFIKIKVKIQAINGSLTVITSETKEKVNEKTPADTHQR